MNPAEMPQRKPLHPIQGRFSEVARKWQTLSRQQRWEEADEIKAYGITEGETHDL